MTKIACIGCSWTEGAEQNNDTIGNIETYPYILNQWLAKEGHDNKMYNAGRAGSGLAFYPFMTDYLLKTFDPDIFIIQITTHDRGIFPFDPIEDDRKEMKFGWDNENDYYKIWDNNVNVVHLSPGFGASASKHSKENRWEPIVKSIWERKVKDRVAPELSYSDFKTYIV